MYLNEIFPNLYHVVLPKPQLGETFMRFSEYSESPKFRGKVFTKKEFEDWYIANAQEVIDKQCTYAMDWGGFNIPARVFNVFKIGHFNPLDEKEKELLSALQVIKNKKFHVIGTHADGDIETIEHEIGHGFYDLDTIYQKNTRAIVREMNVRGRNSIRDLLVFFNYHPQRFVDETQAYLLHPDWLEEQGIPKRFIEAASRKVRNEFKESCIRLRKA